MPWQGGNVIVVSLKLSGLPEGLADLPTQAHWSEEWHVSGCMSTNRLESRRLGNRQWLGAYR